MSMKSTLVVVVTISTWGCSACIEERPRETASSAVPAMATFRTEELKGFKVSIPTEMQLAGTVPAEDFFLYTVSQPDGEELVRVYYGTAPSRLAPPDAKRVAKGTHAHPVECSRWGNGSSFECIVAATAVGPYVHAYYENLKPDHRPIANRIIESIQLEE